MASKASKKSPRIAKREHADGTVVQLRQIKTGTQAVATLKVRSRPGTFEWKYARHGNARYHAGSDFARLWERAGIASAGSKNFLAAIGGGINMGSITDARCMALDKLREINNGLGGPIMRRLVLYCVEGKTSREIGTSYGITEERMTHVLDVDLAELAREMQYGAVDLSGGNP